MLALFFLLISIGLALGLALAGYGSDAPWEDR